jgi:hypothetical protein
MTQKRTPMCRTDLFSTLCGLDKTAYDVASSVGNDCFPVQFHGHRIAGAGNRIFRLWRCGHRQRHRVCDGGLESIDPDGDDLCADQPDYFGRLGLTLYPGCDKTLGATGCGKFSNHLNFQGEPHFLGTAAAAQQV